jgi:hypothetical protein
MAKPPDRNPISGPEAGDMATTKQSDFKKPGYNLGPSELFKPDPLLALNTAPNHFNSLNRADFTKHPLETGDYGDADCPLNSAKMRIVPESDHYNRRCNCHLCTCG